MLRHFQFGLAISCFWVLLAWLGGALGHPSGLMAAFLACLYAGYAGMAQDWLERHPIVPIRASAVPAIGVAMMTLALANALAS